MRAIILLVLVPLTLSLAGDPELSAGFNALFGSDFTRGQLDYAADAGDGDGLYFGNLIFRPTFLWEDVGNLRVTLTAETADVADPSLEVKLYEASVGMELPLVGELRAGAHYLALGDGGLYNLELGGIDPEPHIYDAKPLGLTLTRDFGSLYCGLTVGLGRVDEASDDSLFSLTLGYADGAIDVALYAVADSRPYDVRNLFYSQYSSRAPGMRNNVKPSAWDYREAQFGALNTRHDPLQTLALGLTLEGGGEDQLGYYLALAYTSYADEAPETSSGNLTGGSHLFIYPELVFRAGWFEAYVAGQVDYWRSNDPDGLNLFSPYDARDLISSTLAYEVYAEGAVRVTDNLKLGLGGGYTEPSTSGEDVAETAGDDALDASFFATPRLYWEARSDTVRYRLTLAGTYRQWAVALYDISGGDVDESREITAWLRAEVYM